MQIQAHTNCTKLVSLKLRAKSRGGEHGVPRNAVSAGVNDCTKLVRMERQMRREKPSPGDRQTETREAW